MADDRLDLWTAAARLGVPRTTLRGVVAADPARYGAVRERVKRRPWQASPLRWLVPAAALELLAADLGLRGRGA